MVELTLLGGPGLSRVLQDWAYFWMLVSPMRVLPLRERLQRKRRHFTVVKQMWRTGGAEWARFTRYWSGIAVTRMHYPERP